MGRRGLGFFRSLHLFRGVFQGLPGDRDSGTGVRHTGCRDAGFRD